MNATEKLSEFDLVLVVDKSGSMGEEDLPGNRSRWDYMQETGVQVAREMCKIDSDGIGLVLFSGASIEVKDGCNVDAVKSAFASNRPGGGTPLAEALKEAFKLAGKSDKKDLIVVFTDGVPDDKRAVADVIRRQSNSQANDDDLTILFVQVGRDAAASAYLKQLDDDLTGCKFDIVDAKTIDEVEKYGSVADLLVDAIAG